MNAVRSCVAGSIPLSIRPVLRLTRRWPAASPRFRHIWTRVLPALLDARRADLERVRRELTDTRTANTTAQHEVYGRLMAARDSLYALADEAVDIIRTATTAHAEGEH